MAQEFITPTVIARTALATLYNTIVLAGLVWRDFDVDFTGKQGDTVTVRKPAVFTAEEFVRANGVTLQDADEDSVDITLDTIANVSFLVTDEQMLLEVEDFQGQLLDPAAEAIAQKVDGDLAEALIDAAEGVGGGGTAAIGAGNANDVFRAARRILSRNKLPVMDRNAVLSPEAVAEATSDDLLVTANQSGSTDALREADIGRVFGINTYESQVFGEGAGDKGVSDGVAFHKSAMVLASRPLPRPRGVAAEQVAVENYKGLSLRTVFDYNHTYKQDEVSVDLLYGLEATRVGGIVQLDFGQGS